MIAKALVSGQLGPPNGLSRGALPDASQIVADTEFLVSPGQIGRNAPAYRIRNTHD
jgi:hypothetical protein